jgi:hypothetical protein
MQSNDYNVCPGPQTLSYFNNSKMNLEKLNAINQKLTNINIILNPEIMMHEFNILGASKPISLNATLWSPKNVF